MLRSYGRERSLLFVYLIKKQQFEKTLIEVLLPVETVFRNFEDVLRLRNLIASHFFLAEAKPGLGVRRDQVCRYHQGELVHCGVTGQR